MNAVTTSETGASSGRMMGLTVAGTFAQLAMVIAGHFVPAISQAFAAGGVGISLVFGAMYGWRGCASRGKAAVGGLVVGGVCALIGIAVSCALGDVEPIVLTFGTASSAVAGAIGGAIAHAVHGKKT